MRMTHKVIYSLMIVLAVFLSEWSYGKMTIHTIDSRSESLRQILQDISLNDAGELSKRGWHYPEQVLRNWNEAERLIRVPFRQTIRRRLELVSLLNMGTANARLLENAGIDSLEKLARQKADVLFPELIRVNRSLRLRNKPLVERRVVAWINASRRQSSFY